MGEDGVPLNSYSESLSETMTGHEEEAKPL